MNEPLVSVIIPVFNAADWIEATIESVRAQTHRTLEIIIVDDGSTDASPQKVAKIARQDARIRLIVQPNGGVARARNAGLDASTGTFFAPIDADDIWAPRKIELQLAALQKAPRAALAYNWFRRIDPTGRVLPPSPVPVVDGPAFFRHLEWNFISNGSTPLVRADVARAIRYEPALRDAGCEGCEDYLFQLQVARRHDFVCVPHFLTGYRQLPNSMGSSAERMTRSHLALFAIMAREAPSEARPVIARRRAQLQLTLAILQARARSARCLTSFLSALADDPIAVGRSLLDRARQGQNAQTPSPVALHFDAYDIDAIDGAWATQRSIVMLNRLKQMDQLRAG